MFRFTLSNLMLMMVPLAVALAGVRYLTNGCRFDVGNLIVAIMAVTFALPAMIGALTGGSRGMAKSLAEVLVTFLKLIVIIVFVIAGIMIMASILQKFGAR